MADRSTSIPGNQIEDDSIKQDELDITNTPTDGQFIIINMPTGDFTAVDLGNVAVIATMQTNIVLNAFRIAINGSLTQFNMVDGIVDEYEDELSVDTANSTNESYNATDDFYTSSTGADTKLLLHLNGSDGATSTTDSSLSAHAITFIGTAQLDTDKKQFGTASLLLDGNSDNLTIPDSADWDVIADNTSSWTIDFWINAPLSNNGYAMGQFVGASDEWSILISPSGFITFNAENAEMSQLNFNSGSGALTANTWQHVAFVRVGTDMGIYVDGVQKGYLAQGSNTSTFASILEIGALNAGTFLEGNLDEIRVTKNNAFSASPNVGLSDTFTAPTSEHSIKEDMTLISESFTAVAEPDNARIVLFEEDVDSITLNTDLKPFVSRDAGQIFTTDFATDDKLDITAHGFANDDRIIVTSSSQDLPAGLSSAIVYFVINQTTNDFELSLTSGGSAVDITDNGTGTHTARQFTEITLANDGEYESGKNILTGSIDISGQPSGTSMKYLVSTLNNKELNIHGCGLSWD